VGFRRLLKGAAILSAARLLSTAFGISVLILIATAFDASSSTDAYFVAHSISFLFTGALESCLSLAFVPAFIHLREKEGEDAAWRLAMGLVRSVLLALCFCVLAIVFVAPFLARHLAPGFDDTTVHTAVRLIRIMAPIMPVVFLGVFLSTMEFIGGRFLLPAVAMVLQALAGPLALLLFAESFGVDALAGGIVVGVFARCVVLMVGFRQKSRFYGPAARLRDPAMLQLGRTMAARLLTTWFVELNLIVDRFFASTLGPGYVSYLAFASRAVTALVRLVMMPLGRVLMPALSQLAVQGQHERMRKLLTRIVGLVGFLVIPLTIYLAGFRHDVLQFFLQRGSFAADSVNLTAYALLFYSLGIVPFLLTPLLNGSFFAMQKTAVPLKIGAIAVGANVICDVVLMRFLGHGGIALATSIVGALRAVLLWDALRRRIGVLDSVSIMRSFTMSIISSCVALWFVNLINRLVPSLELPGGLFAELTLYAVEGLVIYLGLQAILNRPALRQVTLLLRQRRSSSSV